MNWRQYWTGMENNKLNMDATRASDICGTSNEMR
jgi:hypothetical protein